jgi:hypothetical protein
LTSLYGFQARCSRRCCGWTPSPYSLPTITQPVFDGWNLQGQYDLQKGRYSNSRRFTALCS